MSLLLLSASNLNARCNPANEDESHSTASQSRPADHRHLLQQLQDGASANNTASEVQHHCDAAKEDSEQQTPDCVQT